jgi:hypothetical protein
VKGNPNNLRVPKNGWITIAFVPKGTDVPPPPNWQDKVNKANGGQTGHNNTPTTMPNNASTSAPSTPTTTPAAAPPTTAPSAPPTTAK